MIRKLFLLLVVAEKEDYVPAMLTLADAIPVKTG